MYGVETAGKLESGKLGTIPYNDINEKQQDRENFKLLRHNFFQEFFHLKYFLNS